jgi:tetratricopeptide (TPR) repeat protein
MMSSARDRLLAISLLLVIVVAATYWPVRSFDFVMTDDNVLVFQNRYYQPVSVDNTFHFWKQPHEGLYMPITYSVWALLANVAQVTSPLAATNPAETAAASPSELTPTLDPGIFHSFNLLLHIVNMLLVFALLRFLLRNDWAAGFGAAVFGLHPVQVESVAWVSELKGVMAGCWGLLALYFYCRSWRSLESEELPEGAAPSGEDKQPFSFLFYTGSLMAFLLALFSKPTSVALPLMAAVIAVLLLKVSPRRVLLSLLPWLVLIFPLIWLTRGAQPVHEMMVPLWARPLIALDALSFYLAKVALPWELLSEYGRSPDVVFAHGWLYWTWILPIAVTIYLWRARQSKPALCAAGGLFCAALLPVSGLVPFSYQYYSTVADRYLYLPLIGVALMAAWLVSHTKFSRRSALLPVGVLAALAVLTAIQVRHWKNAETLYAYTLSHRPQSYLALIGAGSTAQVCNRPQEALSYFKRAIKAKPRFGEAYLNVGVLLLHLRQPKPAIEYFVKACELAPTMTDAYIGLGSSYKAIGQYKYAILALRRAAELDADNLKVQLQLFEVYSRMHDAHNAGRHLAQIRGMIADPASFNLTIATILEDNNLLREAIPYRVALVRLRPTDASLHYNLGLTLLRDGNARGAESAFRNALKIQPDLVSAHCSLVVAFAQLGRFSQARSHLRQALTIEPDSRTAQQLSAWLKARELAAHAIRP